MTDNKKKFSEALIATRANGMRLSIAPAEIQELCFEIDKKKPKTFVEIGSRHGGSFYLLSQFCEKNAKVISIDLPESHWGARDSQKTLYKVDNMLKTEGFDSHIILGDSHKEETKEKLLEILDGNKIDLLFLDGDHRYEGVKLDWEMYSPLVENYVGFHDIDFVKTDKNNCDVRTLWQSLKKEYKYKEFITTYGTGILCKNNPCK